MSFVQGFYSFNLELTNADRGVSASLRIKTPRHPYESLQFLYARILAFCHAYEPDLTFSQGLYNVDEPTIWKRDLLQNPIRWIEVGSCEPKKLQNALRHATRQKIPLTASAYFFDKEHIDHFCNGLRGSKSNWIEPVTFFYIPSNTLDKVCETERSSARWTVTIIDEAMFLNCDGHDIEGPVTELDMWAEYQRSIQNISDA